MAKQTDPKARWATHGGPLLLVWTTAKRIPRPEDRPSCTHCGQPLGFAHREDGRTIHATCAMQPVDEHGICAHARCCCMGHREDTP